MRVSAKSDYALRALIEMASRRTAGPVSAEELGRLQEIPHGFLQAILADLRRAGVVIRQRGQSGGWRMGRTSDSVSVADVIRAVDGPLVSGLRAAPRGGHLQRLRRGAPARLDRRPEQAARRVRAGLHPRSPTAGCPRRSPRAPPPRTPGSRTEPVVRLSRAYIPAVADDPAGGGGGGSQPLLEPAPLPLQPRVAPLEHRRVLAQPHHLDQDVREDVGGEGQLVLGGRFLGRDPRRCGPPGQQVGRVADHVVARVRDDLGPPLRDLEQVVVPPGDARAARRPR